MSKNQFVIILSPQYKQQGSGLNTLKIGGLGG